MSLMAAPRRTLARFFGKAGPRLAALMLPTWENGTPTYPVHNFENAVRDGLRKNEIIYACLTTKTNAAASIRLRVMDKATQLELPDHPLRTLLERPNPFFAEFDLWKMLLIHRDLTGVSYWEKRRNPLGQVVQLWPLRPDWMRPIKSEVDFISGYLYGPSGGDAVMLHPRDVLTYKNYDPLNLYGTLAPVQVAGRIGDVDNAVTDLTKLILEKGGIPPGALIVQDVLDDTAISDIQRRWQLRYGGYTKWTVPAVLTNGAKYEKMGMSFSEMGLEAMDYRSEARICMVLEVPPVLIHALVGLRRSTFNNFESTRRAWWTDTMIPMFKNVADTTANQLLPEFGDDSVYLDWDFSKVVALHEESNTRWQRITNAYRGGMMTLNEARAELDLADMGPEGDVFVHLTAKGETGAPGGAIPTGGLGGG